MSQQSNIQTNLVSAIHLEREEELASEQAREEEEKRSRLTSLYRKGLVKSFKSASSEDYDRWLRIYIAKYGMENLSYKSKDFVAGTRASNEDFFVALKDFELTKELCGTNSLDIIVPEGITFSVAEQGHVDIYPMYEGDDVSLFMPSMQRKVQVYQGFVL